MTKREQLDNCKLALRLWRERVKPENVIRGLYYFQSPCGTTHCFGGHLAHWSEFREMGVDCDIDSAPTTLQMHPYEVSEWLFGANLFRAESAFEYKMFGHEYDIIIGRLETQIETLKREIES